MKLALEALATVPGGVRLSRTNSFGYRVEVLGASSESRDLEAAISGLLKGLLVPEAARAETEGT